MEVIVTFDTISGNLCGPNKNKIKIFQENLHL